MELHIINPIETQPTSHKRPRPVREGEEECFLCHGPVVMADAHYEMVVLGIGEDHFAVGRGVECKCPSGTEFRDPDETSDLGITAAEWKILEGLPGYLGVQPLGRCCLGKRVPVSVRFVPANADAKQKHK